MPFYQEQALLKVLITGGRRVGESKNGKAVVAYQLYRIINSDFTSSVSVIPVCRCLRDLCARDNEFAK